MKKFDMKGDWNERAKSNAMAFIACDDNASETVFHESGIKDCAKLLQGIEDRVQGSVLEIGCGIGRMLKPLVGRFSRLEGVDVSSEMIRQGQQRLRDCPTIALHEIDGTGPLPYGPAEFDFCFSYITLHHIPIKSVVVKYIEEAYRVLKPHGIFKFQVLGIKDTLWMKVRERFTKKSTWRG